MTQYTFSQGTEKNDWWSVHPELYFVPFSYVNS